MKRSKELLGLIELFFFQITSNTGSQIVGNWIREVEHWLWRLLKLDFLALLFCRLIALSLLSDHIANFAVLTQIESELGRARKSHFELVDVLIIFQVLRVS